MTDEIIASNEAETKAKRRRYHKSQIVGNEVVVGADSYSAEMLPTNILHYFSAHWLAVVLRNTGDPAATYSTLLTGNIPKSGRRSGNGDGTASHVETAIAHAIADETLAAVAAKAKTEGAPIKPKELASMHPDHVTDAMKLVKGMSKEKRAEMRRQPPVVAHLHRLKGGATSVLSLIGK